MKSKILSLAAGAPQPLEPHLLTLSMLPRTQWQSLVHLDAIKVGAGCLCTDVDSGGLAACWPGVMLHASCSIVGLCGAAHALAVYGLAWLWTHAVTCALLNLSSFSSQKLSQVWFGEALAQ